MAISLNLPIFSQILRTLIHSAIPSALLLGVLANPAAAFNFRPIGTYQTGVFNEGASEISAYDPTTQRLFVTNGFQNRIDILGISDPTTPALFANIDLNSFGGGVNSVAFNNGLLAVAVENENKQDAGSVIFFNSAGQFLKSVTVGALPDMLTFTPDGNKILVANEGEPNSDYTVDPEGSVSIIDLSGGVENATVTTAGFTQFNNASLDPSVRIFGPNATAAQDFEPEYITISKDSTKAWVTLQENNAIAILDIATGTFSEVVGLGFKDHSLPGNGLDASDRDGKINIANWPVFGMYQPDAIASYIAGDKTYLVTANEGDARDYDGFAEEERVRNLNLDPTAFPNASDLQRNSALGRLQVTNTLGDTDGDGDFDALYAFGSRSFSIRDEEGNLIFDSGDDFEQIIAQLYPEFFNVSNDDNNFDSRSDNKGPEPEGLTIGVIGERTYAFIGLERFGGVIIYDITDPTNPSFTEYVNNRNFLVDPEAGTIAGTIGDLGPEGVLFIPGKQSPNGRPLIVTTNEVSGTTTVYSVPEPTSAVGLMVFGTVSWLTLKRKRQTPQ